MTRETVTPNQATPNPPIRPERKQVHGEEILIVPVADLVRMELSSYRLKDQVHIQALDASGLITPEIEKTVAAAIG